MDERTERSIVQGGRRMFLKLLTAAGVVGGLGLVPQPAAAQTTLSVPGGPRVSPAFTYRRLAKDEAAVLLVDHQSGLISLSVERQKRRPPGTLRMVTEIFSSPATRRMRFFIVDGLMPSGSAMRAAVFPRDWIFPHSTGFRGNALNPS